MKTLYTEDPPFDGKGQAIFLAGPTPRSRDVKSWRPEALRLLCDKGFDGTAIVPERGDYSAKIDYLNQVEWERSGLELCSVILFWVPRELSKMPAFTTNVEFGHYVGKRPCVYGRPPEAPNNRYLDWLYTRETAWDPLNTLEETIQSAVDKAKAYGLPSTFHPTA